MRAAIALSCAVLSLAVALPSAGLAQGSGSRSAAAEAYDRGTAAYLDGNYARSAQWFETADRLSPAAPALMQAVRAHYKAENQAKSASLALILQDRYAAEPAAQQFADTILEELGPQLHKIEVSCEACTTESDGALQANLVFFVEADTEHSVDAVFEHGTVNQTAEGPAGETSVLEFEAPPAPPKPVASDDTSPGGSFTSPDAKSKSRPPLPIYVPIIGGVLTLGAAAGGLVFTLSGNTAVEDFNDAGIAYRDCVTRVEMGDACSDNPDETPESLNKTATDLLDDADGAHTPALILWVVTGVLAAGTVATLFFTDFGGEEESDLTFGVVPTPQGAFGAVSGRF